jgi:Rrf2 family protein
MGVAIVSLRAEYAVKAVLRLALTHGGEPVQAKEIAAFGGIPAKFVEQIMHDLRAARLVTSVRGRAGGYVLARTPEEITFADVVDATKGSHDAASAGRKRGADALVEPVWRRVDAAMRDILESVTIADVTANAVSSPMYYI